MIGGLSCQLSFSRSCSSPVALGSLGLGIPRVSTIYRLRFSLLLLLTCFVVSITPNPAFADPLSIEDILGTITSNALNDQMANNAVIDDLAARWYDADSVKQDKMPVFNSINGKDLRDYSKELFLAATTAMGVNSWRMRSFDGSEVLYYGDPSFDIEYGKWYEYFTGQDLSGGGSTGDTSTVIDNLNECFPSYVTISTTRRISTSYRYFLYKSGVVNSNGTVSVSYDGSILGYISSTEGDNYTPDINVFLPVALSDIINDYLDSSHDVFMAIGESGSAYFYAIPSGTYDEPTWVDGRFYNIVNKTDHDVQFDVVVASNSRLYGIDAGDFLGYCFSSWSVTSKTCNAGKFFTGGSSRPAPVYMAWLSSVGSGGGSDEPVYPTPPQPSTPTTPTPPEVTTPDPSTPPVDNPGTGTTVNNNTYNVTNNTTTVDLQPILDALGVINDNVKVISRNFADFSDYMQGWTGRMYRMVYDWLKALDGDLTAWARSLYDMIDGWFGRLSALVADWDRLLWQELRTANQWLEGIFYKLGSGSSSEPDITYKPAGWWDWLGDILSGLLGDLPGAVSSLSGAFDGLHNLFPFSLPWDLAAMIALLVSEPVTPVFDLPVPYAVGGTAMVHVDLSPWDGVMVAVRSVMLLLFALGLLLRTRELLKGTEVPS